MYPTKAGRSFGALTSHRFLLRAGLAATLSYAWIFIFQYFYIYYGNLDKAFLHALALYGLSQIITALVTPYAAQKLSDGIIKRMSAGVFLCTLSYGALATALLGYTGIYGLIFFALLFGAYRAFYWIPYVVESQSSLERAGISAEYFLALMPAIAGVSIGGGSIAAATLLFAGTTIFLASLAPLLSVKEQYERFSWSYRGTFGAFFDAANNDIAESAFLRGMQGTALLLLWPLALFMLLKFSYAALGLVLTASLLLMLLLHPVVIKHYQRRPLFFALAAGSGWLLRIVAATPISIILVNSYGAHGIRPSEQVSLEQTAENGTYTDEYTALTELGLCLGRIFMCVIAGLAIAALTLPYGIAFAFALAGGAAAVSALGSKNAKLFA